MLFLASILRWPTSQCLQSWHPLSFLFDFLDMSLLSANGDLKTVLASCPHAKPLTMACCIAGEHPFRQVGLRMVKSASWIEQDSACLQRQSAGKQEVSVRQPRVQGVGGTQSRIGTMSSFSLQGLRGLRSW